MSDGDRFNLQGPKTLPHALPPGQARVVLGAWQALLAHRRTAEASHQHPAAASSRLATRLAAVESGREATTQP